VAQRKLKIKYGVNGAFLTRRWEDPINFMRLTRETGYRAHSFCADTLDPFFSGDRDYQLQTAREIRAAAAQYGVEICDIYTGVATHRFHGLSHSNPVVRHKMQEWMIACMDIASAMGVARIGGHWDAFSVEVMEDPARTEEAWKRLVATFRDLSVVAKQKGLAALYQEQMYIPSEKPWTLAEAERFLLETNKDSAGVPVRLTLDVGHMAGMHYGLGGKDLDYREWLRQFGAVCEIVHVQQTTPEASHHWPFSESCNARGHVSIEETIEMIRQSHAAFTASPLAGIMDPVDQVWLVLEYIPGSTINETQVLESLKISANYLAKFVPAEGMEIEI
jgi:D-erythrulose 1-phosphate 3-epimerase